MSGGEKTGCGSETVDSRRNPAGGRLYLNIMGSVSRRCGIDTAFIDDLTDDPGVTRCRLSVVERNNALQPQNFIMPKPPPHTAETVFFRRSINLSRKYGTLDVPGEFLPRKYQYAESEETPDIIIIQENWGPPMSPALWREVVRMRRRYGFRPMLLSFISEPGNPHLPVDLNLSSAPSKRGRECAANIALMQVYHDQLHRSLLPETQRKDERREKLLATDKTRFCSFIYTDDYLPYTTVRRNFCRLLSRYRRVDCPGRSLNNMQRILRGREPRLDFIAGCRFSIAFENTSLEHYLTEKLGDALYAGAVPIYWGSPRAAEYFNPEAFINCHDYDSFENAVKRVIEIDKDPQLYEKYRNAPPILPDSRFYRMKQEVEKRCAFIVREALRRRSLRRRPLWDALRLCAMILRYLPVWIKGRAILAYKRTHRKFPWIKDVRDALRRLHLRRIRRANPLS